MKDDYGALLVLARRLAQVAEDEIVPRFRNCTVSYKDDGSEVTDADRAAEEAIRTVLARECPDDEVVGEEFGGELHDDDRRRWVVDPIDGTASFALGVPTFGTLIAVTEGLEPVVGVIHLPALRETFFAARGHGCWFRAGDGRSTRMRVGAVETLVDAVVSATGAAWADLAGTDGRPRVGAVLDAARRFRLVGDCLQHGLVARGTVHSAIDPVMHPWDIAAVVPCVEEAGGIVSDLSGSREGVVASGSLVSSCSAALHRQVLARL
ncbi:MAG: inositol phosphatase [bacterium]|nr:inositol phosphatase [bacterium]